MTDAGWIHIKRTRFQSRPGPSLAGLVIGKQPLHILRTLEEILISVKQSRIERVDDVQRVLRRRVNSHSFTTM